MKRFLFPGIVAALMLAACQDATRPVAILKAPRNPSADVQADASTLEQFLVRADEDYVAPSAEDLSAALAAFGGPSAAATSETTQCTGILIGAFDKVEVPPGADCFLVNSTVQQWVKADALSGLALFNTHVGGNVMGHGARYTQALNNSHVEGSMSVNNGVSAGFATCAVFASTIDGNFTCNNGNPGSPRVFGNSTIGGNLKIVGNSGPFGLQLQVTRIGSNAHVNNNSSLGTKRVNFNIVSNTLECQNNAPLFIGGPNTAARAQGQCF